MLHQRGEFLGSLHSSGNPSGDILMVVGFGSRYTPKYLTASDRGTRRSSTLVGKVLRIIAHALRRVQCQMFTLIKIEN